ncbi:probable peroxisomal acyl-coenzyme A oxidase 1 isoform X1 [Maniola jurtina]|uniref:probable peroxisomal acyl-coenzyme A oxidase 1 isoform X1 n=2 Tax=Maniola jurtina TaxID=191418 RepID=UPI001E6886FE|nr:probable peroxisomal acyl-coenzyme A oxidase 1 isoform X1 [Maniola jurtina]
MKANKTKYDVNPDLAKERLKCNFNIEEVTFIIDGGKEKTLQRKKIEDIALNNGDSLDEVPEECLSIKERYENAVRKSCIYSNKVRREMLEITGIENYASPVLRRTADAFFKDISPFMLHLGMFVPALMGQSTPDQLAEWLPKALDMQIIGAYAQTELGHGTFIRGLETTATYDPEKEEFVLHSPTLTSYKWWAGGLGTTANHCVVMAQLYTKGECHGTHLFIVQIRDLDTHMPLTGIKVGEIGPRMGFSSADNGFLGFNQFRIPRENMLMKHAKVEKDGTYVKSARHGKLTYGTMVFVRVTLVSEMSFNISKAATIAVRYSAVRRQSELRPNEPEPQILDYPTQQHKLFICIATAHAFQLTASWLWNTYEVVMADMKKGNVDALPELHALSSCLKAVSTSDALSHIEQCRFACGGHGYMLSSNLPFLYSFVAATRTYEGDYTVLLLQTARFLVKAWEQAEAGKGVTQTVSYLNRSANSKRVNWDNTHEGIIKSFQAIAAGKIAQCVKSIRDRIKSGMDYEDAWLMTTVQLVGAAEAHCRAVLLGTYWNEMKRITKTSSENVRKVLHQLAVLYLMYWALEKTGDLLKYASVSKKDLDELQRRYEELLAELRPNAVGLVDAFDLRDEILHSSLGSYDGRVYERLMEEAQKSPLNAEPVNPSFHKYIKPLMLGKL